MPLCSLRDHILARKDSLSIVKSKLVVQPASCMPVPTWWLNDNGERLFDEICCAVDIPMYKYVGYSTGNYTVNSNSQKKIGGITLRFVDINSGEEAYAIFNAQLTRSKDTTHGKKGERLPKKQFRVGDRSGFIKFWKSTGLELHRPSVLHDYMGNLKTVLFSFEKDETGKVKNDTLAPLSISLDQIKHALKGDILPSISQAPPKHHPSKSQASTTSIDSELDHTAQGLESNRTTCNSNYDTSKQGSTCKGNRLGVISNPIPVHTQEAQNDQILQAIKTPQEQTCDEWLDDFN